MCVLLSPQAHLHLTFIILRDHMLVSVCLLDINLNVSTKPEKLGSSIDTTKFKYISQRVRWKLCVCVYVKYELAYLKQTLICYSSRHDRLHSSNIDCLDTILHSHQSYPTKMTDGQTHNPCLKQTFHPHLMHSIKITFTKGSAVSMVTCYKLAGTGIESHWGG
jgi:hypothetical protein